LSQVILSMQLPFAVIPLIHFTNNRRRMGEFANRMWVKILAWTSAAIIVSLNVRLVITAIGDWLEAAQRFRLAIWLLVVPLVVALGFLLLWVTLKPFIPQWMRRFGRAPVILPEPALGNFQAPAYRRILVPLDHTDLDRRAISHAAALAKAHSARLY